MRSSCFSVGGNAAAAAVLLGLAVAAPSPKHGGPQYTVSQSRADAVKEAFQVSWDGYYKYAFPHDSLRPVTNRYADDRLVLPGGALLRFGDGGV
jgi:mannosyl-oligosaccharide alpha-1,2-mannosidase